MRIRGFLSIALVLSACLSIKVRADSPDSSLSTLKSAITKSLALIEEGAAGHRDARKCFTCHGSSLPVLAMVEARQRGFTIDEQELQLQLEHTVAHLRRGKSKYLKGEGQGGSQMTAGYALWTLETGGWTGDEVTAAVSHYLVTDDDADYWPCTSKRPPSEVSDFSATYLAVRGIAAFGSKDHADSIKVRREASLAWTIRTEPKETEDTVFRLLSLDRLGADPAEIQAAAKPLVDGQQEDGGWAQKPEMECDAYATGTALYALQQTGQLSTEDPAYQRGVKFLLQHQLEDGSWYVKSRSKPFQKQFESGFPHGKDQFISIAASCWATIALLQAFPLASDSDDKPNIVMVVVDDLGWADLGCYGADLHKTPHIDRFAKTAVRFTNAYAAASICTPTRASIMTGKYPARLHMTVWREKALTGPVTRRGLTTASAVPNLPHAETTLAEALREAGYFTAHLGKWHLGGADFYPETHGFDVNIGASLWGAPPTFFYPYRGPFGGQKEYRYVPGLEWGEPDEYLTDRLTNEAIDVVRRVKDRPFFLHLAYHTVHTPIEAKPETVDRFQGDVRPGMHHQNATYAAMVASLDENFGRLLATLEELGLTDSTAIVFVSDNGGYVNDYKGSVVTNNFPLRSGKGSLYEGGIRVPLMIRAAGKSAAAVCSTPVVTNDLYPTCLDFANTTHATDHDGLSLTPLLSDSESRLDRDTLYFHYPHFYPTTSPVSAMRSGDWKLLHYYIDGHDELYDLSTDPSELHDLVDSQPAVAKEMRLRLEDWLDSVEARRPSTSESGE